MDKDKIHNMFFSDLQMYINWFYADKIDPEETRRNTLINQYFAYPNIFVGHMVREYDISKFVINNNTESLLEHLFFGRDKDNHSYADILNDIYIQHKQKLYEPKYKPVANTYTSTLNNKLIDKLTNKSCVTNIKYDNDSIKSLSTTPSYKYNQSVLSPINKPILSSSTSNNISSPLVIKLSQQDYKTPQQLLISSQKSPTPVLSQQSLTPALSQQLPTPTSSKKLSSPTSSKKMLTPTSSQQLPTPTSSKKMLTPTSSKKILTPTSSLQKLPIRGGYIRYIKYKTKYLNLKNRL